MKRNEIIETIAGVVFVMAIGYILFKFMKFIYELF